MHSATVLSQLLPLWSWARDRTNCGQMLLPWIVADFQPSSSVKQQMHRTQAPSALWRTEIESPALASKNKTIAISLSRQTGCWTTYVLFGTTAIGKHSPLSNDRNRFIRTIIVFVALARCRFDCDDHGRPQQLARTVTLKRYEQHNTITKNNEIF